MDWTYALIMLFAALAGVLLSRRSQARLPLTARDKWSIGMAAFCGAMIGAKLPFVLSDWQAAVDGSAWFRHGKTIMGGLIGGYFGVEVAKWVLQIRIKTGDSFAVPVAAAVGIGRLGCLHAECCYGTTSELPWAMVFSSVDQLSRHPTQVYESLFHLAMAGVLFWLGQQGKLRGQLIKLYILSYLGYRFITEFIRPEAHWWAGLTAYQWAAVGLVPVFVGLWIRDERVRRTKSAIRS